MADLVPESEQQYGSILTVLGESAEQNGKMLKKPVEFTHIAFGDANDTYVQPDRKAQSLVNELYRIPVNSVDVLQPTPDSVPILKVEALIPDDIHDIVIREFAAVATFNGQSYFHAVGNCARVYVPNPVNNGQLNNPVSLEMTFVITSAEPIVEIDPLVVTASRQYVKDKQQTWVQTKDLDYEQIHAKLGLRGGMRLAFLGDSIMAGVGADGGTYGEANKEWITFPCMLSSSLVFADQGFNRVDEIFKDGDGKIYYHLAGLHGLPYVKLEIPQGQSRLMLRGQDFVKAYPDISIYYYSSSLSDYTDFNVSIYDDGVFIKTEHIKAVRDRFVIDGITDRDVEPQLTCHTINIGQLLYGNVELVIDSPSAGKIVQIVGVTTGRGVHYKNFGVSSSTLKNNSSANAARGITTDGQIQKALDFNADYIFLNWGTNDSKTNVSSLAEYNSELKRRIREIRSLAPNVTLVLCTYPQGRPESQYKNNELYAQEMRKVASDMDVTLVDVNKLFKLNDEGGSYNQDYNIYADDVHPSVNGYSLWASSVCSKLKVPFYSLSKKPKDRELFVFPPGGEVKFSKTSVNVSNPSSAGSEIKEIISGEIFNTEGVVSDIYVTALVRCGATPEIQGQTTLYLELSADDGATWFEKDMLTLESNVEHTPYTQFTLRCHHSGSKGSYKYRISGQNYHIRSLIQSRLDWNISPR
ncbi:GDSL-type esterase/lipase family protein [Vibrio vulnificus]|uniref:GDSL-type esterase/lipase family protein n=1 Tax=Vibrio vulnificus TaxID=672 RepID=UPI003241F68E